MSFAKARLAFMKNLKLFLIEDDVDDVEFLRDAFSYNNIHCDIEVASVGDEALPLLLKGPLPDIIILDLNLPRMHGRDVLQQLKSTPELTDIPVVVFTTSSQREDIEFATSVGADLFITKPNSADGFSAAIAQICNLVA